MDVKLVVANGKNFGQEIPIPGPKFLIGRADDCDLRPRSDVISRYHCTIVVEKNIVLVRDSTSKNGTFVNGEQIMGEQELKSGDRLRVGQLEFDVVLSSDDDKVAGARKDGALGGLDLSDWIDREDSSGTVLGILPLHRANSIGPEIPPEKSGEAERGDEGTKSTDEG